MSDTKRLTDAEVIRDRGLAEATMETVASATEAEEARGRLDADHLQARDDVAKLVKRLREMLPNGHDWSCASGRSPVWPGRAKPPCDCATGRLLAEVGQ